MENILLQKDGQTVIVTINREKQLNALNRATLGEIQQAFASLREDPTVRGVILTGAGEKAFAAGADIKEFMDYSAEQGQALAKWGHEIMNAISDFPKPVVAAINGFALGGGLELALACHIRIVSENAKLGLPEVSLGLIPGYGGTQRLAQLVGRGKAMEMILSGDMILADDAKTWGLANEVTAGDQLMDRCKAILERTYQRSANAVATAIQAVNAGFSHAASGLSKEIELFGNCFGTDDFKEGVDAFLSKRKPNF